MSEPSAPARIFSALANVGAIGICLFDSHGTVTARIGARDAFLPDIGGNVEDSPLFVGLMESIQRLKADGGFVEMPSLGMDARSSERFDLRIAWLESEDCFAALVHPASQRIELEFTVAQSARQNRLLMERVQQQQEQIRAQNELMRVFITHVPAAVAMLDDEMKYLMVSDRWREDFAGSAAEFLGKPFAQGLPMPAKRWSTALKRPQAKNAKGIEKLNAPDGAATWHRWERQDWQAAGRNKSGRLVFSENITRSVEQTARLRAQAASLAGLNAQMRQFSLAISHDLRAPIRQISAFARFLQEEDAGTLSVDGAENVELIQQCANRMLGMMDALLAYARVSQAAPVMARTSLAKTVAAATANLKADIAARGAVVECTTRLAVRGDSALLALVLQNLIDNSLKYATSPTPHIVVEAQAQGGDMLVQFTDNGPGIAPHLQTKAFDIFQRLGASQNIAGAGVGLAMCRKIVELHGGTMVITTEYAAGLRYVIQLPGAARRRAVS